MPNTYDMFRDVFLHKGRPFFFGVRSPSVWVGGIKPVWSLTSPPWRSQLQLVFWLHWVKLEKLQLPDSLSCCRCDVQLKNHLKIYKKSQLFWRQFPTKKRRLYLVASNQPPWGDCKDWESLRFWNPRYGLCACWCGCGRSQSDEFLYRCGPLTCFWVYSSLAKGWDQIRSWNTLHLALTPFTAK